MRNTIKASEKALKDVFSDDYCFSIPTYQRPYAWTTEQAGELFDDLNLAMGEGDAEDASPYFLGSIVLIKKTERPEADVVDGQQRLTTLTVLMCVLRDRMKKKKQEAVAQKYICEEGDEFAGTRDRYRLMTREQKFFADKIQKQGATKALPDVDPSEKEARRRILENAKYLSKRVGELRAQRRRKLLTFMIQRCFLVVVEASDNLSAYRIFSVMNDRGLDLSPTDILKADIIGAIRSEEERETYTEIWEQIEEDLERDRFRDLFAHIRMIRRRNKLSETLEAEFQKFIKPKDNPKKFIDGTLKPMAEAYLSIVNQDANGSQYARDISRSLRHLAMLDNYDWQPPTILFMSKFSSKPKYVKSFLTAIDSLAYGMFICRWNVNERIARYAKIIKEIESDGHGILSEGSSIYLSKKTRRLVLQELDGPVYETPRIRKTILLRLDEAVSTGEATYDYRIITVEHVLPQNPEDDGEWLEAFPHEESRILWTHRLANLVLLARAKNSQAQNFAFERKKKEYFVRKGTSPFALTSQVLQTDAWTPEILEERQKTLLETCKKIWSLS